MNSEQVPIAAEVGNLVAPSAGGNNLASGRRSYRALIQQAIRSLRNKSGADRKQITRFITENHKLTPAGKKLLSSTLTVMLKEKSLVKNVTATGTLLKLNDAGVVAPSAGRCGRKKKRRATGRRRKKSRACKRRRKKRRAGSKRRKKRRCAPRRKKKRRCARRKKRKAGRRRRRRMRSCSSTRRRR